MQIVSVNVGLPVEIPIGDSSVPTGIFKYPVSGLIPVRTLNLDGDRQADLTVHGGPDKAVYWYPSEHYEFWQRALSQPLGWGAFGENLTVTGMEFSEDTISIGDHLAVGTAVFQVTQPRLPCFKLAAKFQRDDIIKQFLNSRRTGFYTRVLTEGALQAGDMIHLLKQDPQRVSIRELTDVYVNKRPDRSQLDRVLSVAALPTSWHDYFEEIRSR